MANLSDLADELLLEIAEHVAAQIDHLHCRSATRYFRRYNPLYVLSRVSRRLRCIVMPLLFCDLEFYDWREFFQAISNLSYDPVYDPRHVKSQEQRFHARFRPLFIPLIFFSKLEQLRLHLRNQRWKRPDETVTEWHLPIDCTTTLTHLTLHDLKQSYSAHVNGLLQNLHFPNLRVFSLQDTAQDAYLVFDFVNRHPSILEFNVNFAYDEVRLRCIPKLIDGTGTWKMPSTPEQFTKYSGSINDLLVDQPTLEDVENFPLEDRRPSDIDTGVMYCRSFAFCRRQLPGVTAHASSIGSKQPRYEATALALCITRQEDLWGGAHVIRDLAIVLYILYRFFPRLEQLRILDETVLEAEVSWYDYMDSLAEALKHFEDLRRLAIGWPLDDLAWSWTKARENSGYSILDAVCPPSIELGSGSLPTLDEYGDLSTGIGGRTLADDVCQELGIVKDDLDEEDDQLIMKAWEARNTHIVARVMRMLATRCPKLEEIDWYPHTDLDDTELELSYVRWRWTVNRDAVGYVRLVHGRLTWEDRPKGDLAPQLIAVGEELEYLRQINE